MTGSDGKVKGYVDSIYCGSGVDGDGLRVVVFFCGCNLRCGFCHNPETLFKKGREVTVDEVVQRCLRYRGYIRRGGVTLSGGEPFLQKAFCLALISELKRENVNVAIETNGKITDEDLIKAADSFIVDVKNQETDDLSGISKYRIPGFGSVRHTRRISKIYDSLLRNLAHNLPGHGESAHSGIKHSDRRICYIYHLIRYLLSTLFQGTEKLP